jgi:purine-binding chemotaxis protein CheW
MATESNTEKIRLSKQQANQNTKPSSPPGAAAAEESDVRQLICFTLGGRSFGLDVGCVDEIIRPPEIEPADPDQPWVMGTITVREKTIPLVDLRVRMGLPAIEDIPDARVILCEYPDAAFGLLVDGVTEVLRSPKSRIHRHKDEACYGAPELYGATYADNEKNITILDCSRLRS